MPGAVQDWRFPWSKFEAIVDLPRGEAAGGRGRCDADSFVGSSKIGAKDQPPITFNAERQLARDRLVWVCTTDVTLKTKRIPCYFLPVVPVTPTSAPVIFFEEFHYKPLWNRRLLMISSYIGPQFCDSPLYFALLIQELLKARRKRVQRRPVLSKLARALIDPRTCTVRRAAHRRELFIAAKQRPASSPSTMSAACPVAAKLGVNPAHRQITRSRNGASARVTPWLPWPPRFDPGIRS